ncbi:hypothetical protein Sta7437_0964 [Stanieria cyanosphaera PCC 7437]|uniref:Haloacid dehalogenase-like hydrolase n=1 Tax=Stanieria cyanosphaera (strain ATCC 29371 / PCC 7437) TaxID=111780 RepID=K9XR52_STAC7|nr:haloacid dehalogenase-like hydrolase [Stanieria cyanosphaera]AFZ34546.1 hypothetical protein Sta7437_0964 [Stanieria cyanosphaera PCC 7437]
MSEQIKKTEAITSVATASQNTPIIIDFDETLFLRNSTAEYLDNLKPRILGFLLLKFLYLLKPWNWLPEKFKKSKVEDWFLVITSTIFLPWTWFFWQKKARKLAKRYQNLELLAAINNIGSPIIVATVGFNFIVNPILNQIPIKYDRLVGCRFWQGFKDRTEGKLLMLKKVLSQEQLASAIAITDSEDDLPLLREVAKPCLVIWPLAEYIPPLQNVYLPFLYVEKVKRFGEQYLAKVIIWEDLPLLWLAFSWQASNTLLHGTSISLFLISFWCVYEIGYYENDFVAEKYEAKPKLSNQYHQYKKMMQTWHPWLWALMFAVLGDVFLTKAEGITTPVNYELIFPQLQSLNPIWIHLIFWIFLLLTTRFCFWIFNYLNKHTRTWFYLLLQSCRYYGFLAIAPTNLIGSSLICSQILSQTILYIVYRYAGGNANNWPSQVPRRMLRMVMFSLILSAIAIGARDFSLWLNFQTWAIMAWCVIQSRRQILNFISQIKPVVKDGSNQVT